MREVARRVNEVLRPTYHSKRVNGDLYAFRFMFTRYPKPTISLIVYENRDKLFEIPIQNIEEFVNAIDEAYEILGNEGLLGSSDNQPEEENYEERRRSRSSTTRRSSRRQRSSRRSSSRQSERRLRRD